MKALDDWGSIYGFSVGASCLFHHIPPPNKFVKFLTRKFSSRIGRFGIRRAVPSFDICPHELVRLHRRVCSFLRLQNTAGKLREG
jgi:hypothetical protein